MAYNLFYFNSVVICTLGTENTVVWQLSLSNLDVLIKYEFIILSRHVINLFRGHD